MMIAAIAIVAISLILALVSHKHEQRDLQIIAGKRMLIKDYIDKQKSLFVQKLIKKRNHILTYKSTGPKAYGQRKKR